MKKIKSYFSFFSFFLMMLIEKQKLKVILIRTLIMKNTHLVYKNLYDI